MKKIILIISFIVLGLFNQHAIADVVYVHNDALGSPIMESDANGAIIPGSHSHYKPFGETLEASKDDVGYTGHLNDSDLGLTYMQARYYDPVIGRFYSNDPLGFRDIHSFNRYAYANNNPYRYTDPTGMSSDCWLCKAGTSYGPRQPVDGKMAEQVQGGRDAINNKVDKAKSKGKDPAKSTESIKDYKETTLPELANAASAVALVTLAIPKVAITATLAANALDDTPTNQVGTASAVLGTLIGAINPVLGQVIENIGTVTGAASILSEKE